MTADVINLTDRRSNDNQPTKSQCLCWGCVYERLSHQLNALEADAEGLLFIPTDRITSIAADVRATVEALAANAEGGQ